MLEFRIKKIQETEDDNLPFEICERVSYSGINSLFLKVDKNILQLNEQDIKINEYDKKIAEL